MVLNLVSVGTMAKEINHLRSLSILITRQLCFKNSRLSDRKWKAAPFYEKQIHHSLSIIVALKTVITYPGTLHLPFATNCCY